MGSVFTKQINAKFFQAWSSDMAYVLGYIVADDCIGISKERRKNPFSLNITSAEKTHLYRIRKALDSEHKISEKMGGAKNISFAIQIRNPVLTSDLMALGILPRKTYHLDPIKVPKGYFPDFVRGFFDGDGSVYIYTVNGVPQIKAEFIATSLLFIIDFNKKLCKNLNIPIKAIHKNLSNQKRIMTTYNICFYVDDCEKLYKFMYGLNPRLYLPRKRRIFEKWKSIRRRHYVKQKYPSKVDWHLNQAVTA